MLIQKEVSLKSYNTFGLDVRSKFFIEVKSVEEFLSFLRLPESKNNPVLILGGGSNMLFTKDYEGIVVKNSIKGINKLREDEHHVYLKAGAGENWHEFVLFCIENHLAGVENLSLIPGTVGAAPMQNIGAYGVEIKDTVYEVEAVELATGNLKVFSNADCHFGYRESVFKNVYKDQFVITSVTFRLNKMPNFNISYGAIKQVLDEKGIKNLSIKAISDAVIAIRKSKLPDPAVLGNAGSFFKNPEIDKEKALALKALYEDMPQYPTSDPLKIKLAAGWLIEKCGWKGKRVGETGSHKDQALVLVNYGKAKGEEIWNLALEIKRSVWDKFGVEIIPEVNIIK